MDNHQDDPKATPNFTRTAKGIAAAKCVSGQRYILMSGNMLSKSTQSGIFDKSAGEWLLRVDKAHKGVNHAHINLNPKLTGVKDPHIKIPEFAAPASKRGVEVLGYIGKGAMVIAVAADTHRIVSAACHDLKESGSLGKETAKAGATVTGGWVGGIIGATGGRAIGSWIGSSIGSVFGGVGAVPGAAIGSLIGTYIGGAMGGNSGYDIAQQGINAITGDLNNVQLIHCNDDDDDDDDDVTQLEQNVNVTYVNKNVFN